MAVYSKSSRFIVDGKALSEARTAANLRLEDVALQLGCNKSQVSRWEQGLLVPSEERIFQMAELLRSWAFVRGNPHYKFPK